MNMVLKWSDGISLFQIAAGTLAYLTAIIVGSDMRPFAVACLVAATAATMLAVVGSSGVSSASLEKDADRAIALDLGLAGCAAAIALLAAGFNLPAAMALTVLFLGIAGIFVSVAVRVARCVSPHPTWALVLAATPLIGSVLGRAARRYLARGLRRPAH